VIRASAFAGQCYAVLGLARSGLATVESLLASGAGVTGWDDREEARATLPEGARAVEFITGDLSIFDSIVVTPGLPLNRHPIAARAEEAGVEIIGDIELFARARSELPAHKVVGITGTNGKSTTTALIHHILKAAGVPCLMGGNIGLPILSQDPLPEGGVYVLELSSYQIDLTRSLDCDVAVLLNITPDHLDRYSGFEAYAASKRRLFQMQSNGVAIDLTCAPSDEGTQAAPALSGRQVNWPSLQGPHNLQNAVAAIRTCQALGIDDSAIEEGLRTYPGLPHRMERVRERNGVLFVNDSKATNATATAPALAAYPAIRWIVGGLAKSDRLDECEPWFDHVRKAYTIGDAGEIFARLLSPHMAVAQCGTLRAAVAAAAAEAGEGEVVLLSPAAASFDQFRDFEQRGEEFRATVGAL
jgi:UDP-N-acetylmuramoylalanine--D-glutamate ligase